MRKDAGRVVFSSPLHKSVRAARDDQALGAIMDGARAAGEGEWNTAMSALVYKSMDSAIHYHWLARAFEDDTIGGVPDAWSEAWMRSQFLQCTLDKNPKLFCQVMQKWPEAVAWDIARPDGRCSLLLKAGWKGSIDAARAMLEQFPGILDKTIQTNDNAIGKLLFNGFARQGDGSWLKLLHEFDPGLLYRTSEDNQTAIIEMLAERHMDQVLDQVLAFSNDHDPGQRHGLALVHFAAKGVKSARMDKNTHRMRQLEAEEMLVLAHGFIRTAHVLARHGHDIMAKALKQHQSDGSRPRGYPLAGSNVLGYFLKRNKAGSLPSEVLAHLHSAIMGITTPAPAPGPSRAARF